MPKISAAQGPSHEGVIAEHDADLRENGARVDVQEPILPQEDPSLGGQFHAERNAVEGEEEVPYSEWSKSDLRAEIDRRNEDRDEADRIPVSGTATELAERLETDDEADEDEDGE